VNRSHSPVVCVSECRRFGVEIPEAVVEKILRYCSDSVQVETGGILIGYYNPEHTRAIVAEATGPPADSTRLPRRFIRGVQGLQQLLDRLWNRQRLYYLGEWHFHPDSSSLPSQQDLREMLKISRNRLTECPEPLLVIIGGEPDANWSMSVSVQSAKQVIPLAKSSTAAVAGSESSWTA